MNGSFLELEHGISDMVSLGFWNDKAKRAHTRRLTPLLLTNAYHPALIK